MNCFVTYWTKGLSDKIPSTSETTGEIAERQANMLTLATTQLLLTCLYMGLLPSLICNRIVLCLSKLLFSTHSPRAGRSHTWSRESFFRLSVHKGSLVQTSVARKFILLAAFRYLWKYSSFSDEQKQVLQICNRFLEVGLCGAQQILLEPRSIKGHISCLLLSSSFQFWVTRRICLHAFNAHKTHQQHCILPLSETRLDTVSG